MIKVGIIGAAGYTAGELIRILINHPCANILFAQSKSHAGQPVWMAHHDLVGETSLTFSADAPVQNVDVIFLCMGHGKSRDFVDQLPRDYNGKIIDLILPLIVLISVCIYGMLYTGGIHDGKSISDAFADCDAAKSLALGSFIALIFISAMYLHIV